MLYISHDTPTFITEALCLARDVQLLNCLILNLVRQRASLLRPHLPTPSITGKTGKQYNQLFTTHTHAYIHTEVILRNQVHAWFNKKQQIILVVNKGLIRHEILMHRHTYMHMHACSRAHAHIHFKVQS